MKIAIVHDWLVVYGGAERVLEQILNVFPDADLYSLIDFVSEEQRKFIQKKKTKTSFLQSFPGAKTQYRNYLPFMPLAIEQFDFSEYDLVISSSHAVSKGVITAPHQLHICFFNGFMHYIWDQQTLYLGKTPKNKFKDAFSRLVFHYIRNWDYLSSQRPDLCIVNSRFSAISLQKFYKRTAKIIYPPVNTDFIDINSQKEDYYITVARFVPIKKIDLIVQTFTQMDKPLIVVGDGPEFSNIQKFAGEKIKFLGFQPTEVIKSYLAKARAFVFASNEPFGIVSVEAQACGTPVIAFGKGGALETVLENQTGVFFKNQTIEALQDAVERFEKMSFDPDVIRKNAERFSAERFRLEFKNFVDAAWQDFQEQKLT
jgi:glycosyltransferase involved in cell wall biosynthesis